jgi:hypothetical protein
MTLTTATLGDHLAAQGVETNELYSRGARVRKREAAVDASIAVAPTEFLAVKVVTPPESVPTPRTALCRITHRAGHVIEFSEWPEASWLAALLGGVPGTTP